MPFEVVQIAGREALNWLGDQFRNAARRGSRLSHATRLLLDPDEGVSAHTERDWQEFIPNNNPFAFAAHHRPVGGVQQSCFYGDESQLDPFLSLALLMCREMPGNFLRMRGCPANEFRAGAHYWVLAVYHIAVRSDGQIPLRYSGSTTEAPVGESVTPWPWALAVDFDQDLEAERENLTRWHAEQARKRKKKTRYVYASLKQDVFTASALAVEYILAHERSLYTPYEELALGEKLGGR